MVLNWQSTCSDSGDFMKGHKFWKRDSLAMDCALASCGNSKDELSLKLRQEIGRLLLS